MAKSKEELIYDIENELVDPTTNKITGERVKARLLDMVAAMGTGRGNMEYWAPSETQAISLVTAMYCPIIKLIVEGETQFLPGSIIYTSPGSTILAVAFDRTYRFGVSGEIVTMDDLLTDLGWDDSNFVKITEEEFYTA